MPHTVSLLLLRRELFEAHWFARVVFGVWLSASCVALLPSCVQLSCVPFCTAQLCVFPSCVVLADLWSHCDPPSCDSFAAVWSHCDPPCCVVTL